MDRELSKKIYDKKTIDKIDKKILLLGSSKLNAVSFLNKRLISSVIIFIASLYIFKYGYIIAPLITIIYYYLFEKVSLDDKLKQRKIKLEDEAIYFFEVLSLSLETGRNLEEAITVTIESVDSEISNEFKNMLREIKFGKSLNESLTDMQKRIPSEEINNIILSLTESNIFGSSIISNISNQIEYLREKRRLEMKAEISKLPIKISVVSVFFFIPLILLIIIGPVILSYVG